MNNIKNKSVQYSKKMFISLLGITTWSSCVNSVNKLSFNEPVAPAPYNSTMQTNNGTPTLGNHSLSKDYHTNKNKEEKLNLLQKEVQQGIEKIQMMDECDHDNCLRYNSKTHTHSKLCPICIADMIHNPKCNNSDKLSDIIKTYGINVVLGPNSERLSYKLFFNSQHEHKLAFLKELAKHTNLDDWLSTNTRILNALLCDGKIKDKATVLHELAKHINLKNFLKRNTQATLSLLKLFISKAEIDDKITLLEELAKHVDLHDALSTNKQILPGLFNPKNHYSYEVSLFLLELKKHVNLSELAFKSDVDILAKIALSGYLWRGDLDKILHLFEDYVKKT